MAITTGSLTITPIHPLLGAEIGGVDLSRPLDDATFARIAEAFDEHSVLVFHDQPLTDEQQAAFSRRFGPLETTVRTLGNEDRHGAYIVDLSNTDDSGRLMPWSDRRMLYQSGNQLWHTDSSFKPVPAHSSALSARVVPPEGGEKVADSRVALDREHKASLYARADVPDSWIVRIGATVSPVAIPAVSIPVVDLLR